MRRSALVSLRSHRRLNFSYSRLLASFHSSPFEKRKYDWLIKVGPYLDRLKRLPTKYRLSHLGISEAFCFTGSSLIYSWWKNLQFQCETGGVVITAESDFDLTFKSTTFLASDSTTKNTSDAAQPPTRTAENIAAKQLEVLLQSANNRSSGSKWLTYFELEELELALFYRSFSTKSLVAHRLPAIRMCKSTLTWPS